MSLVINTNIASMQGQNNLAKTQAQQAQTFQRLSTGLRVNSAKDDAGGLYLAQAQTKDIRGLSMATRNAGDGISMAQTAEGALDQVQSNLQRINELAIQSANGTYSQEARNGLQKEVDQLTQEINRIVETTEFNGNKLLNGDAKSETLQIGFKNDAGSRIQTGIEKGILDGRLTSDSNERTYTFAGAKDGETFDLKTTEVISGKTTNADVVKAFNEVTAEEFGLALNANDPADGFVIGSTMAGDINTWLADLTASGLGLADDGETAYTATTTINGIQFTATVNAAATATNLNGATFGGLAATVNGETVTLTAPTVTAWTGSGNYAGSASNFEVAIGGEDEPIEFKSSVEVVANNALVGILAGELDSPKTVNISDQENAQLAIQQTREAINFVSELRADFGAQMNRFETVISGNQTYSENLSAARSRIQDADFAVETANLAKLQVLQQAGISALGQANASAQSVLGLL